MSELTVTKAKITGGDKIEIHYRKKVEGEDRPVKVVEEHKSTPHPDLKSAFEKLDIHSALIGELIPMNSVPDIENPDESITGRFHVSGFTRVAVDEDNEGVILTAQKTLSTGEVLTFNTPTKRFNSTMENVYPYMNQLQKAVENAIVEAELYLGGKYAIDPQGKLELDS